MRLPQYNVLKDNLLTFLNTGLIEYTRLALLLCTVCLPIGWTVEKEQEVWEHVARWVCLVLGSFRHV